MMFRGSYDTDFYCGLYDLLHRDLDARQALAADSGQSSALQAEVDRIDEEWQELARRERGCRSSAPTRIEKHYATPLTPDLSRSWN